MQLNMKYDKDVVLPAIKPQCFPVNGKKNPLVPVTKEGWSVLFFLISFKTYILIFKFLRRRHWNWKEKHYLIADTPGSRFTVKLTTTVGNIEVHYLRSYQYNLGSAKCWVDDEVDKAMRLDGYWKESYNIGR